MSNQKIFKEIYIKQLWRPEKEKNNFKFYSGPGSHYKEFTSKYVDNVKEFLLSFEKKPNAVDLGCGDFFIGNQLRNYCEKYIAADIFEELINNNKSLYHKQNVDFIVLDITKDNLPEGEVCFIRQVLQHLSNSDIKKFLKQINGKYKYLIITEHLPDLKKFKYNLDIITGPEIRLYKNSGVVLTEAPFDILPISEKTICNVRSEKILGFEGVLNTKIYQLKK